MFHIGADPEILVQHGGVLRSAIGKLPGNKHKPFRTQHGAVQVDNVMAEFNIHPVKSVDDFDMQIGLVLGELREMLAAHELSFSDLQIGEYSWDELDHPDAQRSGCDPDFNAYTGMMNEAPMVEVIPLRSAGGHVHVGTKLTEDEQVQLIKALDFFLTIPGMYHEDPSRRQLYGLAGAYRPKPYGVEYRTPSNYWVFKSARRQWIYYRVQEALQKFRDFVLPDSIPDIINNHDLGAASKLISKYGLTPCPQ